MGRPATPLAGLRFGRLLVLERAPREATRAVRDRTRAAWVCRCDCGRTTIVRAQSLVMGYTRSCGCLRDEVVAKRNVARARAAAARKRGWSEPRPTPPPKIEPPRFDDSGLAALMRPVAQPRGGRVHRMQDD